MFKNHCGAMIFSFAHNIGFCSVVKIELWAIYHKINIARQRGFREFEVESNSYVAINLVHDGCCITHPCSSIVQSIQEFVLKGGVFSWSHAMREANQVVDRMANFGLSLQSQIRVLDFIILCIVDSVLVNVVSIVFPRGS